MEEKIRIAAIGNVSTISLFNAVGIKTYISEDETEISKLVASLHEEGCKIIYLAEELYMRFPELIEKYKSETFPILIPLPLTEDSLGVGRQKIRANVEKAIGMDIL